MPRALSSIDPMLFCGAVGNLRIPTNGVHVWSLFLQTAASCRRACAQILSRDEQARAERFVDARSRDEFIVAHGALRMLLARYTRLPAATLRFARGAHGKPMLASPSDGGHSIAFNMTHSHGRALIAVSDGRDVGIDLEQVNPQVKGLALARRYFCSAELAAIESAALSRRARCFFRYWVAKEAVLKGQGIGLKFPIDQFEIQFDARHQRAWARTRADSPLADDWRIRMLAVHKDFVGAVAARGDNWKVLNRPGAAGA